MKKLTALILSIMMFVSVLSYAGVALAAEANTIRFNMRVTGFRLNETAVLDVDPDADPANPPVIAVLDTGGVEMTGPAPVELPEVDDKPTAQDKIADGATVPTDADGKNLETYVDPAKTLTNDKDYFKDNDAENATDPAIADPAKATVAGAEGAPTAAEFNAEVEDLIEKIQVGDSTVGDFDPNKKYYVEYTKEEISADQTTKVITGTVTGVKVDADGNPLTDADGNPIEEVLEAGTIEVEVTASATFGKADVWTDAQVDSAPTVSFTQKNVVLTVDASRSMGKASAVEDEDGDNEVKWAVLCDTVQTFIKDLYGADNFEQETDKDGNPTGQWKVKKDAALSDENKNIVLDLVLFSDGAFNERVGKAYNNSNVAKLDPTSDSFKLQEICDLLNNFSGSYASDLKALGYAQGKKEHQLTTVEKAGTLDGTNVEAGYYGALEAVKRISDAQGVDFDEFDGKNVTVVFITDGEATSYVKDSGRIQHDESTEKLFKNARTNATKEAVGTSTDPDEYTAMQKLLAQSVKIVNVAIRSEQQNTQPNPNETQFDAVRDYLDPEYTYDLVTPNTTYEDELGNAVHTNKQYNQGQLKEKVSKETRDELDAAKKDQIVKVVIAGKKNQLPTTIYLKCFEIDGEVRKFHQVIGQKPVTTYETTEGVEGYLNSKNVTGVSYAENGEINEKLAAVVDNIQSGIRQETPNPAKNVIQYVGQASLAAYSAKLISVVPKGFDIVAKGDGASFTVIGKDADDNTIIEWEISADALSGDEGFKSTYFLLPNNTLGDNYQFGTVLTNESTTLVATEVDEEGKTVVGGKTVAIVLDRPVLTLAADANEDEPLSEKILSSIQLNTATPLGNLRENDSRGDKDNQPEQKLVAYGTKVGSMQAFGLLDDGGTYVELDKNALSLSYQVKGESGVYYGLNDGDPDQRAFEADGRSGAFTLYETTGGAKNSVGTLEVDSKGNVTFTKTSDSFTLGEDTLLEINFNYNLNYNTIAAEGLSKVSAQELEWRNLEDEVHDLQDELAAAAALGEDTALIEDALNTKVSACEGAHQQYSTLIAQYSQTVTAAAKATINLFGDPKPIIDDPIVDPIIDPIVDPIIPDAPGPVGPAAPVTPVTPIEPEPVPLAGPETPAAEPAEEARETIVAEETPLAAPAGATWSLVNLILTIATGLASVLMLLGIGGKQRSALRLSTIAPCIGAVVAFLLTEDMGNAMAMTDAWTPLMVAIAAIQTGLVVFSVKGVKAVNPDEISAK